MKLLRLTWILSFLMLGPASPPSHGDRVSFELRPSVGAVFSMTNSRSGNEIVMFRRGLDGRLTLVGRFPTGGMGSGSTLAGPIDPLGSQAALILSRNRRLLFAVNAGSDEVSVARVRDDRLSLVDKIGSGGPFPVSLTQYGRLLYVLNVGGDGNITGFEIDSFGRLTPLADSTRSLGLGGSNPPHTFFTPAQIEFTPDGRALVVAYKGTDEIGVFPIGADGLPSDEPIKSPSSGGFPFGFAFDRAGHLLLSEAVPGAVSSYAVEADGRLRTISPSVPNGQLDTCWVALSFDTFAYATNTSSHNITGYLVGDDGTVTLLDPDGITFQLDPPAFPTDLAATRGDRFLYTLNAGTGTVAVFRVGNDGALTFLEEVGGLPALDAAAGMVAF